MLVELAGCIVVAVLALTAIDCFGQTYFFLHHSTGRNLIADGNVRAHLDYDLWDHDYNYIGLSDPSGTLLGYSYAIPNDDTDPIGLYNLWTTDNSARTRILARADIIAFKSCYPACDISSDAMLAQYKTWYIAIRAVLVSHTDKTFVLMSPPPRHRNRTNAAYAARARAFSQWLSTQTAPNVAYYDLFDQLAGSDNVLKYEYERSHTGTDSHPSAYASGIVGPHFAAFLNGLASTPAPPGRPGRVIPMEE
ncbi:hypothetical protein KKC87_04605 [Patescibacteria group bacterium]|nr:hypothetical protein [Patescibacteria group bacterium]